MQARQKQGVSWNSPLSLRPSGEHAYSPLHSMLNPFQPIKKIEVQRFTSLPAKFRKRRRTAWSDPNRQGAALDSFLEGPSFDRQGNLWCVDIPFGRIYRIDRKGESAVVVPYDGWPNGITLNQKNSQVYVAITRSQQIWRLPLMAGGTPSKTGVAIQLSGGHAGPDGIEFDDEDGLIVCHLGVGIWRFDSNCLPTHLVHSGSVHRLMTNIAFRGKTLYITDSANGEILMAQMPVAGKKMFSMR